MQEDKQRIPTARRRALLGLAGGVVGATQLPATWTKPVVDSVLLPAHAQTTVVPTTTVFMQNFRGQFSVDINFGSIDQPQEGLYATILDTVIPKAHAGFRMSPADMCIEVNGTSFTATLLVNNDILFTASGTVGGGPVTLTDVDGCTSVPTELTVNSASSAGADYTLSGFYSTSGMLPAGSGCPTDPIVGCD